MSHGAAVHFALFDHTCEDVRQGMISFFDPVENARVTFDTWLPRGERSHVYVYRAAHEPDPPVSSSQDEELVASMLSRAIPSWTLDTLVKKAANILKDEAQAASAAKE